MMTHTFEVPELRGDSREVCFTYHDGTTYRCFVPKDKRPGDMCEALIRLRPEEIVSIRDKVNESTRKLNQELAELAAKAAEERRTSAINSATFAPSKVVRDEDGPENGSETDSVCSFEGNGVWV